MRDHAVPTVSVHRVATSRLRRGAGVCVGPAVGLRHAADAGRSAVFVGAAAFSRQSAGPDRAGLQPRTDTDGVSAACRMVSTRSTPGSSLPAGPAHSLDVQYYLIQDDRTGRLLMRNLRDAALRGVRVRLLVDDLYTAGGDAMFRGLAAFPNVEVRLFNPFCCARQSIASKYMASLADFRRLNHRMHNKLFIADGVVAVMGGRNIADEYFTRSATSNFVDMDVFVVGPVVRRARQHLRCLLEQPAGLSGRGHRRRIRRPRRGATRLRPSGRRRRANEVDRRCRRSISSVMAR